MFTYYLYHIYEGTACIFKGWMLSILDDDQGFIFVRSLGSLSSNEMGQGSVSEVRIYVESLVCFHMWTPQDILLGRIDSHREHCNCLLGGDLALHLCSLSFFSDLKTCPQSAQENLNLSLLCVFLWWVRSDLLKNALGHSSHWWGFSLEWAFSCLFLADMWVKPRLQISHWKGSHHEKL